MKYFGWCIISNDGIEVEADNEHEAEKKIVEETKRMVLENDSCTHIELEHVEKVEHKEEG